MCCIYQTGYCDTFSTCLPILHLASLPLSLPSSPLITLLAASVSPSFSSSPSSFSSSFSSSCFLFCVIPILDFGGGVVSPCPPCGHLCLPLSTRQEASLQWFTMYNKDAQVPQQLIFRYVLWFPAQVNGQNGRDLPCCKHYDCNIIMRIHLTFSYCSNQATNFGY